jgi:hypothetical protein
MSSESEVPGAKLPDVVKPDAKDLRFNRRNVLLATSVAAAAPVLGTVISVKPARAEQGRFDYSSDREAKSAARALALESLLIEKGIITDKTVDNVLSFFETQMGPFNGAKIVARAWLDPAFKQKLVDDTPAAILWFLIGRRAPAA